MTHHAIDSSSDVAVPTDPWKVQHDLMAASDQPLPTAPQLNKGVLLYSALMMEEVSETVTGVVAALEHLIGKPAGLDTATVAALAAISNHLAQAKDVMHAESLAVRDILKAAVPDFVADMQEDHIITVADGATDSVVVACGLANSVGIPGAACYDDVGGSNLSKRNPETLRIDKTPDGKWIKGSAYREPNLRKVIYG